MTFTKSFFEQKESHEALYKILSQGLAAVDTHHSVKFNTPEKKQAEKIRRLVQAINECKGDNETLRPILKRVLNEVPDFVTSLNATELSGPLKDVVIQLQLEFAAKPGKSP